MIQRAFVLAGAAALSAMVSGCQQYSAAKSDPDAVKKAIQADEKKWNDEFKAKDQENLIGHYADDAYFAAPGVKADGAMAIRKAYADISSDPNFSLNFASDKIDVSGSDDMAYSRGHFDEQYTDPNTRKVMTDSGSYLTVYKKQQDGSWKAVEDLATSDPGALKEQPPGKAVTHATALPG